jgi:hypothetical protein
VASGDSVAAVEAAAAAGALEDSAAGHPAGAERPAVGELVSR